MKTPHPITNNNSGFVMVFVIFILLLLVMIGISSTSTTTTELQIAAADKVRRTTFYWADGGIYASPKVISSALDNGAAPTGSALGSISYVVSSTIFYRQVMGYDTYTDGITNPALRELAMDLDNDGTQETTVDIQRTSSSLTPGGGVEFASGAEGVGVGSTGGVSIKYTETSFANGSNNAESQIAAGYRKVVGVGGGL